MRFAPIPVVFFILFVGMPFGCTKAEPAAESLIIGVGSDRYSVSANQFNFAVLGPNPNIYETLVTLDDHFELRPLLAEKWLQVAPGIWRMELRKGIRFHDGQPFNAEAARYSLLRFAKYHANFLQMDPESVKVIDPYTIELRSKVPNAFFIGNLAHPLIVMTAPGVDLARTPTGTGPFRFVSYKKDESIIVERNPDYWGPTAKVPKIIFRFIPDPYVRLLSVAKQEIDLAGEVPGSFLNKFSGNYPFKLFSSRPGSYVALSMMTRGKNPFDILRDRNIRKVINYAVDREEITRVVWHGLGQMSPGIVPEISKTKGYVYDPFEANRLLDQSGWKRSPDGIRIKNGRKLALRLVAGFPDGPSFGQTPELLKAQLERVGIRLEIVRVSDEGVYYDHYMKEGQGDLWLESGMNRTGDPTYLLFNLYHSSTQWKWYRWLSAGEAFDRDLNAARKAKSIEEAKGWVAEASRVLVDEEAVIAPIALLPNFYAGSRRIRKFEPHPMEGLDLYSQIELVPEKRRHTAGM